MDWRWIALLLLVPVWLEWLWWRKWFGHFLDDYYYMLAAIAAACAYHSLWSWQGIVFLLLGIGALLFGVDRLVRHK